MSQTGTPQTPPVLRRTPTVLALSLALTVSLLALVGNDLPLLTLSAAWRTMLEAIWAPMLWMVSAWGLGALLILPLGIQRERPACSLALGVSVMLSLDHLLGILALLSPTTAIGLCALGLGAAAWRIAPLVRTFRVDASPWAWTWIPAAGLLLLASASPPGWLFDSEFAGFDALSYHLVLPTEWMSRIQPLSHNVYSFLPSYVESAFVHLAHLTLAPTDEPFRGLVAGSGWRLIGAQQLHMLMAIAGAWVLRRTVIEALHADGDARTIDALGWLAGALVLATPWVLVTGALAYNEMALLLLGAGALLVALQTDLHPGVRAALVAWLVGVACGAKPTALLMLAPACGMLLLHAQRPDRARRCIPVLIVAALVAGLLALAPWLVRNWIASGNPVFPHLTGLFGSGHWTDEQVARYLGAHRFNGSLAQRLALVALPDGEGHLRGMSHPQWGVFWLVVLAGTIAGLARTGRDLRVPLLALGVLVGVGAWLMLTHIQSRFLLALMAPATLLGVLGVARLRCARGLLGAALAVQTLILLGVWFSQRGGMPTMMIARGPAWYTGNAQRQEVRGLDETQARDRLRAIERAGGLPVFAWINLMTPAHDTIYLLGDSTPLYVRAPVAYHTTWDASPLGDAIEAGMTPGEWVAALHAQGIDLVLINLAELARLIERDGWYDPRVTMEHVEALMDALGSPVRAWPEQGRVLFAIGEDTP